MEKLFVLTLGLVLSLVESHGTEIREKRDYDSGSSNSHGDGGFSGYNYDKPTSYQQPEIKELTKYEPVHKTLKIPVSHPVQQPFHVPVPYKVLEPYHIQIPVPFTVEKIVKVPVEKIVKYPVEKLVPVKVVKKVRVPVPKPYPVPVPVYKTSLGKIILARALLADAYSVPVTDRYPWRLEFNYDVISGVLNYLRSKDMDCIATEMYRFLPNADFMTDDFRLKFIKRFLRERDIVKNSLTSFQKMIKEYKLYRYVEERRRARLRIPEIVKDKARIDEIFKLGETVLEVLKEQKFPSQLTMTVPRCMERIRNNFRINRINITRDMVKALKLIKLGTEKENKHDATFLVHIGIKDLKEAVSKEFARANSKY